MNSVQYRLKVQLATSIILHFKHISNLPLSRTEQNLSINQDLFKRATNRNAIGASESPGCTISKELRRISTPDPPALHKLQIIPLLGLLSKFQRTTGTDTVLIHPLPMSRVSYIKEHINVYTLLIHKMN